MDEEKTEETAAEESTESAEVAEEEATSEAVEAVDPAPLPEAREGRLTKAEVAERLINALRLQASARVDTAILLEAYDTAE